MEQDVDRGVKPGKPSQASVRGAALHDVNHSLPQSGTPNDSPDWDCPKGLQSPRGSARLRRCSHRMKCLATPCRHHPVSTIP